jgi:hypothetical protein
LRSIFLVAALLIFLAASTVQVSGSSQQPGFSVSIGSGVSNVSLSVNIFQNLTSLDPSFALPHSRGVLTESNSTPFASVIQNALNAKNPAASVKALRLEAASTAWSNITRTQWLNVSVNFGVDGIAVNNNGIEQVDTSWRSFVLSSNMTVGTLEVNNIGSVYMQEIAGYISGLANTKLVVFTFHINSQTVSRQRFPAAIGTVSVLNFSSLATPLSSWVEAYNSTNNTVYWTSSRLPTFGVLVTETINEATPTKVAFELVYSFNKAVITAPFRSSINGDKIIVVLGDAQATSMGIIIASASAIAIGTTFYERRLLGKTLNRKTKR